MRLALLMLLLTGCGLRSAAGKDGGTGGGGSGGGAGGGSEGPGTYRYEVAPLDDGADAGRVMAISGPGNNLFAASNFGKVYRSTDGIAFKRVLDLKRDLLSVYVAPDGAVFLSAGSQLGVCRRPPCTTESDFVWAAPPGTAADTSFYGLCGDSSSNVFAVGLTSSFNGDGVVVHHDGTSWSSEKPLGITNVRACWLESSNVVWAAGMGQVTKYSGGVSTPQGADLSPLGNLSSAQQWFSLFGVEGELHAVGWSEAIMSRTSTDVWSLTLNHSTLTFALWFRAVAGLRADEVFVAGNAPTGPPALKVWRWDGEAWALAPSFPVMGEVRSAHAVPPSTMYFGGQADMAGDIAVIIRVVRE